MKFEELENLSSLHAHEEELRAESISIINSDEEMLENMMLIANAMNIYFGFTHDHVNRNEDELTLQFLGLRQFNNAAASIKLGMSGYAQIAISLVRDILEVSFLLDYFRSDLTKISEWKKATPKERKTNFSPIAVRTALDNRDGNKEKKRAQAYSLLSEYASHATYGGFNLIRREGLGALGPFVDEMKLKAWIQELALRLIPSAALFSAFFVDVAPPLAALKADFLAQVKAWQEKNFKKVQNTET